MLQDYFIVNSPMSPAGILTQTLPRSSAQSICPKRRQVFRLEQMRVKRKREGERERETTELEKGEVKGDDRREVEKLGRGGCYSSFSSPCVMT